MLLLVDFLMRLSFGLCFGMAITPHNKVTSGYYRNHLYVVLGLAALAALLSRTSAPSAFWFAAVVALGSYVGSVLYLYERVDLGRGVLVALTAAALGGSLATTFDTENAEGGTNTGYAFENPTAGETLTAKQAQQLAGQARRVGAQAGTMALVSRTTSGLLLGVTMAAMLLGHWYLNTPTMELAPLRRLLLGMTAAVALHSLVCVLGLSAEVNGRTMLSTQWMLFVSLRWAFGLFGVAVLTWMSWETLKVPNTQSATGILYVAVIGTFVGETMSILLSAESLFPL
ncbi:MAG: hypothetical protein AAGA92_04980 [Planctomycetota bacterium]